MYPLKKGKTANQAHVGLPGGTYEEEHGRKGFYGKSAHLYHLHPPTGWVRFEGKLRPHCFDLNKLDQRTVVRRRARPSRSSATMT
jgi:homogentisate 1,2-dioxygenase